MVSFKYKVQSTEVNRNSFQSDEVKSTGVQRVLGSRAEQSYVLWISHPQAYCSWMMEETTSHCQLRSTRKAKKSIKKIYISVHVCF